LPTCQLYTRNTSTISNGMLAEGIQFIKGPGAYGHPGKTSTPTPKNNVDQNRKKKPGKDIPPCTKQREQGKRTIGRLLNLIRSFYNNVELKLKHQRRMRHLGESTKRTKKGWEQVEER